MESGSKHFLKLACVFVLALWLTACDRSEDDEQVGGTGGGNQELAQDTLPSAPASDVVAGSNGGDVSVEGSAGAASGDGGSVALVQDPVAGSISGSDGTGPGAGSTDGGTSPSVDETGDGTGGDTGGNTAEQGTEPQPEPEPVVADNPDSGPRPESEVATDPDASGGGTTGSAPGTDTGVPSDLVSLSRQQDCDSLHTYITEVLVEQHTRIADYPYFSCSYYLPPPDILTGGGVASAPQAAPAPTADVSAEADSAGGGASGPQDVSGTNNQEQGVNESDIVKADSKGNFYIVSGRHLVIAKGFPATEMVTLKEVDLGGRGINLFLDETNQRIVVLLRYDSPYYVLPLEPMLDASGASVVPPEPAAGETLVLFFDISNPQDPRLIEQLNLDGYYQDSRRIGKRLHLITRNHNPLPGDFYDRRFHELRNVLSSAIFQARCDGEKVRDPADIAKDPAVMAARDALAADIQQRVAGLDVSALLPGASRGVAHNRQDIPYLACDAVFNPGVRQTLSMSVVSSLDTDGANVNATAIINNAGTVYASKDNLYLSERMYGGWWLSNSPSQTAIHKFAISDSAPVYLGTGTVIGHALNQFNFSEYQGVLRVATTRNEVIRNITADGGFTWQRYASNHLFTLQQANDMKLETLGAVHDFAPDETIRSARFMGTRGFVVTFRNIDPLFTFDLSDPSQPSLEGELEIPGFSTYMHPYDENHLLTVGREGGPDGFGVGDNLKLQLIDVSDLKNPAVMHSRIVGADGYSWSSAQYDHKAFTFYAPAQLLAIPVQYWSRETTQGFSGIYAFDVDLQTGFSEIGRVDHSDLARQDICEQPRIDLSNTVSGDCLSGYYVRWASPRRSVVMTDSNNATYLYTISDLGIKAAAVSNLQSNLASVLFPPQVYPWFYYALPMVSTDVAVISGGIAVAEP